MRDKRHQAVLWNGLRDGLVSTLATDHCPFDFATQKRPGEKDFTKIPYGSKGTIQTGSDADLVVYDPNYRGTLSVKTQTMNVDYNPFESIAVEGRSGVVTVRSRVAARHGQFVGQIGRGQFLQREPSHF